MAAMQTTLDQYTQGAADRLGVGTFCSVTISDGGSLSQVASNDPRAEACDQVEVREGAGPCIQAMDQLHGVLVEDIETDHRWPSWRQAALDNGFRTAVALPGYVDDDVTVAMNAYSEQAQPRWTAQQLVGIDAYVQEFAAALREGSTN